MRHSYFKLTKHNQSIALLSVIHTVEAREWIVCVHLL